MRKSAVFALLLAVCLPACDKPTTEQQPETTGQPSVGAAPTAPPETPPSPPPTDAVELRVVEGQAGLDSETGFIKIAGELYNDSEHWVSTPDVAVELIDAAGKLINAETYAAEVMKERGQNPTGDMVLADRHFIPPGEMTTFQYIRDVKRLKGGEYTRHELSAGAKPMKPGPVVEVEGFQAEKGEFEYWNLSGKITNKGSVPCRSPEAVFGVYDASGKILKADTEVPDETFQKELAPGESVAFLRESLGGEGSSEVKVWATCSLH